jgi:hypothetical protein
MRWWKVALRCWLDPRTLNRDGLPFDDSNSPDPRFMELKERLGEAVNAQDHDGASEVIDEMTRRWPQYPMIFLIAANMYGIMGDFTAARAAAGVGLVLDPDNYNFHLAIGRSLRAEGHDRLAAEVLEQGWRLRTEVWADASDEDRERFFHPGPAERDVDRPLQTEQTKADGDDNDRAYA